MNQPTRAELLAQRDAAVAALQDIHTRIAAVSFSDKAPHDRTPAYVLGACEATAEHGIERAGALTECEWRIRDAAKEAAQLAQIAA